MESIELKVMLNKYDGKIKNQADLEDSFTCWGKQKTIYFNPAQFMYKTEVMACKEFYSPHRELGRYFIMHCVNGEDFYLRESEFDKI